MHLTQSERQFLDALLAGHHSALAVLREQLAAATVEQRDFSGVGFFTHFAVPSSAPKLPVGRWVIRDLGVTHPALENGGGVLLFVDDGALSMLEGYSFASEPWPESDEGFRAEYLTRGPVVAGSSYQLRPAPTRDEAWLAEEYVKAQHRGAAG